MYPFIHLFGFDIPSYGLMMALAFLSAIGISYYRTKKAGLDTDKLLNLALISIISGVIGSYLLYIFVTYPISEIIGCIKDGSFTVFKNGGLVFYGGLILAIILDVLYAKKAKLKISDYASVIIPSIPFAHAIGRIGCFLAGCCYGRVCDTPFSVIYTEPISDVPIGVPVFPVQLLEAACNILVFVILIVYTAKRLKTFSVLFLYLGLYSIERFILEYFRSDEIRGILFGLSTSQWISILLFAGSIVGFILTLKHEKKKRLLSMDFECDGASAIEESKAEYNEVSEDAQAPAIETP